MFSDPQAAADLLQHQLGSLRVFLDDPEVTEIFVNPGGSVFVRRAGHTFAGDCSLDDATIQKAIMAVAKYAGRDAVPHSPTAIVEAQFHNLRFAGALAPVDPAGPFFTIRQHRPARLTLTELIDKAMLTEQQAQILLRCLLDKQCILIAGATDCGKTTLLNALLQHLPPQDRIMVIQDTAEIHIGTPNHVHLLTSPQCGFTPHQYLAAIKRHRPDWLILGEVRGADAYDLIDCFSSGHPGLSTIHANSAATALETLERFYQWGLPSNATLPLPAIRQYIASSVRVVVFLDRKTRPVPGNGTASPPHPRLHPDLYPTVQETKYVREIIQLQGAPDGQYQFQTLVQNGISCVPSARNESFTDDPMRIARGLPAVA